ncbi:MAG: hypothetical protein LUI06_01965 [Ruminococcus sp.]|nr:hypothetical protein [Ruminococcus sp.]
MSRKESFKLNEETRRRIDEEYYAPEGRRVRRVRARAVKPAQKPQPEIKSEPVYASIPSDYDYDYDEPVLDDFEEPKKPKKHRLRRLMIFTAIFCVVVILLNIAFYYYRGQIWFNEPRKRDYPVRGAVVDEELGEIDWEVMSQQTISFTYIRATKGTTTVDEQLKSSRKGVKKTDLLVGFYHEFDFSADGEKQAENYIEQCGDLSGKLRPMVKVTKYGIYNLHMKNAEDVKESLSEFLDAIEEEYGRRCVIMCDSACYEKYIEPYFDDYSLWIIDHFSEPDEYEDWALWEFNPRVRTEGYENSKRYFALSVYRQEKDIDNFKKNFLMD